MKKTDKKLKLKKDTVRVLTPNELSQVAGGLVTTTAILCGHLTWWFCKPTSSCPATTAINCGGGGPATTAINCGS